MNFTDDWFTHNIPNFELCMGRLPCHDVFLEIGSYEGRSTCWLLENGLSSEGWIICIDPYNAEGFDDVLARFKENTRKVRKPEQVVEHLMVKSYDGLAEIIVGVDDPVIDFIYIDGHHAPSSVLTDACMAWPLLKSRGIMLFDDYQYPHEPTKVGIDAFLGAFAGQFEIFIHNYQLGIQKK